VRPRELEDAVQANASFVASGTGDDEGVAAGHSFVVLTSMNRPASDVSQDRSRIRSRRSRGLVPLASMDVHVTLSSSTPDSA
jgi:hypothetical protein